MNTPVRKKHILVVTQYFYPEQFRVNDICLDLVNRGFKVTVLTGYPNYPEGKFHAGYNTKKVSNENYKGIDIIRIPIIARGNKKVTLALNYASFVISGYIWKVINDISADSVFIYEVSPMTQALPGVWYAKKHNIPCYLYVTDLWPENVQIVGNINNEVVLNQIGNMVDYIYENCTRIFTSSKSFITRIKDRGISEDKLEFWPQYAEDYYYPLDKRKTTKNEIPDDDVLNFTFAGNIGYAQGLEILPKVATYFKKRNKKVRFNMIGDGRYKSELVALISEMNVEDYFNLIDRQPAERVKEYMAFSDASLIILSDNELFKLTIPAKVQSSLACGVPVIGSVSGETNNIIKESNAGFSSEAGDVDGLIKNIFEYSQLSEESRKKMKINALNYYEQHFEKNKLMDRLEYWFRY